LGIASLLVLKGVPDRVRNKRNSLLRRATKVVDSSVDFFFDAVAAFAAALEADQVSVGILALDSSQGWRDLFALAVRDTVAFTFNPFVVGGFQDSAAFAVPGAWWVLGSVYWGALLGGPSSFVLGPHPAGQFGCLLPSGGRSGLLGVLG